MSDARLTPASASPVWTVTNGVFASNCYLCATDVPGECFIVDPGLDTAPIEAALAERGMTPRAVLCTHGHFDHVGTAVFFQMQYGCPVHLHERDLKTLRSSNFLLMALKIPARMQMPEVQPVTDAEPLVRIGGANPPMSRDRDRAGCGPTGSRPSPAGARARRGPARLCG